MVETVVDSPCPVCGKKTLVYRAEELDLPYFGKCLETTMICKNCGFRHADVMMLEVHEPMLYEFTIQDEKDLNVKVIRSTSGTIEIPELGAKIEPGPLSEAFITTVEGVLNRIVNVLVQLMHDNPDMKDKINEILRKIGYIRHGKMVAKIILKDPLGNSGIVSEKVRRRRLSEKEIKELKLGEIIYELRRGY